MKFWEPWNFQVNLGFQFDWTFMEMYLLWNNGNIFIDLKYLLKGNGHEFCLVHTQRVKNKSILAFIMYFFVVVVKTVLELFSIVSSYLP